MANFNFESKVKIIASGKSKVFNEWRSALPNLTEKMFIKELEWLCNDPLDSTGKMTREIGLTSHGIVRLERRQEKELTVFRYPNGELWAGDHFYRLCSNKNFADENGMISELHKISLSAKDNV